MDHDHSHEHEHKHSNGLNHRSGSRKALLGALVITGVIMALEFTGGIFSNSLALLSDAGHMLTDFLAIALSLAAMKFAARPADGKKTYGFYRLEILAALLNGASLLMLSGFLAYEAVQRFMVPVKIDTAMMLVVATVGLVSNLACLMLLKGASHSDLNARGAFLHVLGDTLSSAAVIAGAGAIWLTGWTQIDPALTILIALVIIKSAFQLLKESVDILMESTPSGMHGHEVEDEMKRIAGVKEVHHLHIWSLSSGIHSLSAHVVIDDQTTSRSQAILEDIRSTLQKKFSIFHTTIQFECSPCEDCVCTLCDEKPDDHTPPAAR